MEQTTRRGGGELVESIPHTVLLEILSRLDVESLCSAACVCRVLRSSVSQVLSSLSTLDLSGFAPTAQILNRVTSDSYGLRSLTLDCSQLVNSLVSIFAKQNLEELVLQKCHHFAPHIFLAIGQNCSNLRILSLEVVWRDEHYFSTYCKKNIRKMFMGCPHLESLSIKFHSLRPDDIEIIQLHLPKTIKSLILQPVTNRQAAELILSSRLGTDENLPPAIDVHNLVLQPSSHMLQSLALVLDAITDELVATIVSCQHHLIALCLEENPPDKPLLFSDLSNAGLQSLGSMRKLRRLSLSRCRPYSFKRVTDVGVLVLAEGCKGLESIRLGGFSKVTDAGYISILQSCRNMKKFEVVCGHFLSDLAFHDLACAAGSLVEVVLISCSLLTSEAAESLSSCKNLEVLDLGGCKSIADHGLKSIAKLHKLTSLDLSGADITDSGLSALSLGCSPIVTLRLRGCKRITDRGFKKLFNKDSIITKTLSTLDFGFLPGVSDGTITLIAKTCRKISSFCIRHCFFVTGASIMALGLMEEIEGKKRLIKRLDLYFCIGLSIDSIGLFSYPYFQGLRWLGIGNTKLFSKGKERLEEISEERPGLSICVDGCELGCKDGWYHHRPYNT